MKLCLHIPADMSKDELKVGSPLRETVTGVKVVKRTLGPVNDAELCVELFLQSDEAFFSSYSQWMHPL